MNVLTKAFLCVAVLCIFAGCSDPGEGERAQLGYAQGKKILNALESYKSKYCRYPKSLPDLVPDFLIEQDLILAAAKNSVHPFEYTLKKQGDFELIFRYGVPGMNICSYKSTEKVWRCYGHY